MTPTLIIFNYLCSINITVLMLKELEYDKKITPPF